ncbi:unnamed protein product [Paramecium primaurelia]|uniref:Uncharacterized protein n=1 Tax=Paramecium primaurelia TaxID=5886 RepID=A0A8S1PFE3_PARPR|nr:unnamed protein product [Paramecium primaurelia]
MLIKFNTDLLITLSCSEKDGNIIHSLFQKMVSKLYQSRHSILNESFTKSFYANSNYAARKLQYTFYFEFSLTIEKKY